MPRILIQLGKSEYVEHLDREIPVVREKEYFIKDTGSDYHTEYGSISKASLSKKPGSTIRSKGKEFVILDADFIDLYKRISRGAQIIPLKDIGTIIASAGICKDSVVVDAGAGSGALAAMLAKAAKSVTTYEKRDDFAEIVGRNIKQLGLDNLKLKKGDVYKRIDERGVDAVTLDLPEPWLALPQVKKALRIGGFLAVYSPSIPQISDMVESLRKSKGFMFIKVIEIIEREWEFKGRKIRPKSKGIGHSGFLCFARRIR